MSTITDIQITSIYQTTLYVGSTSTATDSDGDNDGSGASGTVGQAGQHGFFSASVLQTFSQFESGNNTSSVNGSTSSSSASGNNVSTTQTPQEQALSAFMHDLFAALREQSAQSYSNQGASQGNVDSDGDYDGSGTSNVSGYGSRGLAKLVGELQSLAQQLSPTGANGQSASNTSTAITTLQSDFQNLMTSLGGASGTTPSLSVFLQSLAQNLQTGNSTGNIVNTQT